MKTIKDYCPQEVEGWHTMPSAFNFAKPGQEHLTCSFLRPDGINLIVSIKDYGRVKILHASIGPIESLSKLTKSELNDFIYQETPSIFQTFFGDRKFAIQPADPARPEVYHYFSLLDDN